MEEDTLNSKSIGVRIKFLREEIRLTQKELAIKLNLNSETAIANYESGYSIPKDEIKYKLCKIFNCSMDYLLCLSDERKPIDIDKIRIGLSSQFNKLSEESQKKVKEQIELLLENEELKRKLKNNKD